MSEAGQSIRRRNSALIRVNDRSLNPIKDALVHPKSSLEHRHPRSVPTLSTMQFKLFSAITLTLATLASLQLPETTAAAAQGILGALGIIIGDIAGQVGLGCAPVSIFGASGGQCSTNTVCCEDNSNSLISLGCVPITL
ncbi:hypothetical protein C8J56DRAFT_1163603 [Mycena floridula]|nr:hypothetical protein C8J56DRAFT_1163603 [Mycena floridula]